MDDPSRTIARHRSGANRRATILLEMRNDKTKSNFWSVYDKNWGRAFFHSDRLPPSRNQATPSRAPTGKNAYVLTRMIFEYFYETVRSS